VRKYSRPLKLIKILFMREKQLMECFTGMEHGNRVKLDSIQVSG